MGNFFSELKRRHIYRVAAAYAVVAWVLLQLVNNLAPGLYIPNWAQSFIIVLLAVGFPIVLVFAWVLELKGPAVGGTSSATTGMLDWALFGALIIVIALVSYQQLGPSRATVTANPQAGVESARVAAAAPAGLSIAVLPFANLSSDPEQAFFSDGMTEEIITALAKIPDLRVVARESAFQYKGAKNDMRAVGQALGATHLIEGSVRKVGDRVRIAAQLVKAEDGVNIWASSYDREMTDVFVIQEDIATAIAGALKMPLGLKPGENLVNNRSIDQDSYQQYLRAKALVVARGQARLVAAAALLEQVVARNPNYAPAWALLGLSYHLQPNTVPERTSGSVEEYRAVVNRLEAKEEAAARRAVQLDPNLADGYLVLASLQGVRGNLLESMESAQSKVFALDPNNSQALHGQALGLAVVGHVKEAVALRQKLQELEPNIQNYMIRTALALWLDGQTDAAIAVLKDLPPDRTDALAIVYASMGRYNDAVGVLENLSAAAYPSGELTEAIRLLRTAPAQTASPQDLPPLGALGWVYVHVGAPERVLEIYERGIAGGYMAGAGDPEIVWHAAYAPVRKTERFKAYARKAGLVEYWRAKGWPDLCHPTTGDDFVCS